MHSKSCLITEHGKKKNEENNQFPYCSMSTIKTTPLKPLLVKLVRDKAGCDIWSIDVTPDGRILIADAKNKKVKMFDQYGEYLTSYLLPGVLGRLYVSVVNADEVIVSTSFYEYLFIMEIKPDELLLKEVIHLQGYREAVTSYQGKLIITSECKPVIQLIDRKGTVLWSRTMHVCDHYRNYTKRPACQPLFHTCFLENQRPFIIVTDPVTNRITKLDGDTGESIKMCDVGGKMTQGVTVDDRYTIYICCRNTREVLAVTPDLQSHIILLSQSHGLCNLPKAIKYNATNAQLLISSEDSIGRNYITRYQVTYS